MLFCGVDWSEDHHDVAIVDETGALVAKRRLTDDAAGFRELLQLLADVGEEATAVIPVAIETPRGLLVACLRATGRPVFAINPMSVSRYRDRHAASKKKSDHADALVLANILRTDMAAHRPLPADSELAQAIAVLARAQQDAVWDRTCAHNKLRSVPREYYPAMLEAFHGKPDGLMRPEARALLAAAPTPTQAARLTKTQPQALPIPTLPRRPHTRHRHRSRPAPGRSARRLSSPAAAGGKRHGTASPSPAPPAQRRLHQRPRTRHRHHRSLPHPPRCADHHKLPRPRWGAPDLPDCGSL